MTSPFQTGLAHLNAAVAAFQQAGITISTATGATPNAIYINNTITSTTIVNVSTTTDTPMPDWPGDHPHASEGHHSQPQTLLHPPKRLKRTPIRKPRTYRISPQRGGGRPFLKFENADWSLLRMEPLPKLLRGDEEELPDAPEVALFDTVSWLGKRSYAAFAAGQKKVVKSALLFETVSKLGKRGLDVYRADSVFGIERQRAKVLRLR